MKTLSKPIHSESLAKVCVCVRVVMRLRPFQVILHPGWCQMKQDLTLTAVFMLHRCVRLCGTQNRRKQLIISQSVAD